MLITLGVIGVVAALTMPTLINKHQEIVLRNRAKKAYSILNNAYFKTLADLEFSNTCFYNTGVGTNSGDCEIFEEQLKKNLNIIKICNDNALSNGCISPQLKGIDEVAKANNPDKSEEEMNEIVNIDISNCGFAANSLRNRYNAWVLNDGLTIIKGYGGASNTKYFAVDTNGLQGPNKWGYDFFIMYARYDNMQKFNFASAIGCHRNEKGGKSMINWIK